MVLMEDGGGSDSGFGVLSSGEILDCDGWDHITFDVDKILDILEEPEIDVPSQSSLVDFSCKNSEVGSATDVCNQWNSPLQNGCHMLDEAHVLESESTDTATFCPSNNLHGRIGESVSSFDNIASSPILLDDYLRLESSSQVTYPMRTCSGSFKELISLDGKDQGERRVNALQSENLSCITAFSLTDEESNHVSNVTAHLDFDIPSGESVTQFAHGGGSKYSKDVSHSLYTDNLNRNSGQYYALTQDTIGSSGPENDCYRYEGVRFEEIDISSHNAENTHPTHNTDVYPELGAHDSDGQFGINSDTNYFVGSSPCFEGDPFFESFSRIEFGEFQTESSCSASEISLIDHCDGKGLPFKSNCVNYKPGISTSFSSNEDCRLVDDKSRGMPFGCTRSAISNGLVSVEDEKPAEVAAFRSMVNHSLEKINGVNKKNSCNDESSCLVQEDVKQSSSMQSKKDIVSMRDERGNMKYALISSQVNGNAVKLPLDRVHWNRNASEKISVNKHSSSIKHEIGSKLILSKGVGHLSSVSHESSSQSNLSGSKSQVDDDSDICILEDISQPAHAHQSLAFGKTNAPMQHSTYGDSIHYSGVGSTRPKANDERFIFRAALQDLSQPKSEANPPEGVLAVPLLRHQRIALSWMAQKETSSLYCSGGILADDQGLGKTVSTIALILKERRPSMKENLQIIKKEEFETLNLDEDDDDVTVVGQIKEADNCQIVSKKGTEKVTNIGGQSKGRPAAGTLIVCPTSVLRQWAEELHKKVTSKANLSVLVYHGSNRTKDPCELAKYDVVLTTYSIVSMEVPKQPIVDEEYDEREKMEDDHVASLGFSSGKKRKYPPTSGKKGSRNKKGMDAALLESISRPLAKVAWFRVVLDEAQSIKNHRTQVARACWGLRAKRRWCLSGTPIQNAIDDLYSYFRFLRYDPYAVYNSFCSTIKIPIQKCPTKGYKKLQAVLKTIMLRRTKGTCIDGKPIINLPPKVIELKKVEFTDEERDFYTRLESDSREQFREYAAAGTVKQNYVNILLMLLRLRQACDHPLLVRGIDSNSLWRSSLEMAKKLPREKQIGLLNCLEASLALCGICNDPPEDAVVSICGHVFCNQCICEHLIGDDKQCPASKCKTQLNTSSVFSKATLNSSLSDDPAQYCSGSELVGAANPCSDGLPYDSSKIRAALEVLQSLNKPQNCTSTNCFLENNSNENVTCPEDLCNAGSSINDNTDKRIISIDENVNGAVKRVGEKAIVFSQWTRMLDLLEACLKCSSVQYRRLDGTMSVVARDKAVKDFNTLPEVSVMIMSLKAASLGLNMVAACHVLLLDLWWNPTTEDQAIDRAHRIGQTRPVTVLRLTVKNTVEDRILALQQKKREMVASAFGEDETGGRQTRLTMEDLKYLFMV